MEISELVLLQGDCLERLKDIEDESVDSLVTDPPAGIAFMGKKWDSDKGGKRQWIAWLSEVMKECRRVLKPGAHGLVWAIPRTSHWTATALEDAGFEIRDVIMHVFGSGFPKSHNVEKATGDKKWEGWGTALKPAAEHWVLVRKPLGEKTVAKNVQKHGTGALNIDASRVETSEKLQGSTVRSDIRGGNFKTAKQNKNLPLFSQSPQGRFPANFICSGEARDLLDEQSGVLKQGGAQRGSIIKSKRGGYGASVGQVEKQINTIGEKPGGASRFFYCAKASKKERNAGLDSEAVTTDDGRNKPIDNPYLRGKTKRQNHHPTVKPLKLMSYLIKLITPPGGVVLDPFAGSGSTGVAALKNGFGFIGIEAEQEYMDIIKARLGIKDGE